MIYVHLGACPTFGYHHHRQLLLCCLTSRVRWNVYLFCINQHNLVVCVSTRGVFSARSTGTTLYLNVECVESLICHDSQLSTSLVQIRDYIAKVNHRSPVLTARIRSYFFCAGVRGQVEGGHSFFLKNGCPGDINFISSLLPHPHPPPSG